MTTCNSKRPISVTICASGLLFVAIMACNLGCRSTPTNRQSVRTRFGTNVVVEMWQHPPSPMLLERRVSILAPAAAVVPAAGTMTLEIVPTSSQLHTNLNWGFIEAGYRQPLLFKIEHTQDLVSGNWNVVTNATGQFSVAAPGRAGFWRISGWDWIAP